MQPPERSDTWVGITDGELPISAAYEWCVLPNCGAVVLFSGTVRDHAVDDGGVMRSGVQHLEYEAYPEQVEASFRRIDDELRARWPHTGRVVLADLVTPGVGYHVRLYLPAQFPSGIPLLSVTTDANGEYLFAEVPAPEDFIIAVFVDSTSIDVLDSELVQSVPGQNVPVGDLVGA